MPELEQQSLGELATRVREANPNRIRLFLITRDVKPDVPPYRRDIYKYIFRTYQLHLTPEVQIFILGRYWDQLNRASVAEPQPYRVIDSDEARVAVFEVADKHFSFLEVFRNQVLQGNDVPAVVDFNTLAGEMWGQVFALEGADGRTLYSLNKTSKAKIAVDERDNAGLVRRFQLRFNTEERRLEFLNDPTLALEGEAAAYFFDERFYIFNKAQFEQTVGIEEEFAASAVAALERVTGSGLVRGLEMAEREFAKSKRLLKRIAHLMVYDDLTELTPARLEKMREVAGHHELRFTIDEGQIRIEDKKDLDDFISLLEDYYLISPQTGHEYGSRVKRRLRKRH